MDPAPRTNYIFVDFENIQDIDLDLIADKAVKVFLIIGQRQKSLAMALARQVHKYHHQVQWIESQGAGRNALDLVLAYQVGAQAKLDPQGYFHILSKDKDYEPLKAHLRANGILASRDEEFAKIPVLLKVKRLSLENRVKLVVERLEKSKASRPKRKQTLLTSIARYCNQELSPAEVQQIMDAMIAQKVIEMTQTDGIVYRM